MLIVLAGLPGTGKSALAAMLAPALSAVVIDKDVVRCALFPRDAIEYTAEQDDFVIGLMLETAGYLFGKMPARPVILDGRTYSRRYQLEAVRGWAVRAGVPCRVIECVCSDGEAVERITRQMASHPAKNRTPELYWRQKAAWERIPEPKCVVDTEQPAEACAARALAWLQTAL